jgi:hypothetical protein
VLHGSCGGVMRRSLSSLKPCQLAARRIAA